MIVPKKEVYYFVIRPLILSGLILHPINPFNLISGVFVVSSLVARDHPAGRDLTLPWSVISCLRVPLGSEPASGPLNHFLQVHTTYRAD